MYIYIAWGGCTRAWARRKKRNKGKKEKKKRILFFLYEGRRRAQSPERRIRREPVREANCDILLSKFYSNLKKSLRGPTDSRTIWSPEYFADGDVKLKDESSDERNHPMDVSTYSGDDFQKRIGETRGCKILYTNYYTARLNKKKRKKNVIQWNE